MWCTLCVKNIVSSRKANQKGIGRAAMGQITEELK